MTKLQYDYQFYGTETTSNEVKSFIRHILQSNLKAEEEERKKYPICIWGRHGIGKTEIVAQLAKAEKYDFAYIAPAQFEEMGDLIGMPAIENDKTVFRAPSWVPNTEGPGILLIDDVNRADDRILRGIMQLLQNFELVSWKLPPKWQIILTANPDGGDYSVTPMDDAMLTRMLHISLKFEVKEWAKWAEENGVDKRGINFVLMHPEVVNGERTTPRTLVQFFETIKEIESLDENLTLVKLLADSCLGEETSNVFINYVGLKVDQFIMPENLLKAVDFEKEMKAILECLSTAGALSVFCERLVNRCVAPDYKITELGIQNLKKFIKMELLPADLRIAFAQDLVNSGKTSLKSILADPEIGQLLLV